MQSDVIPDSRLQDDSKKWIMNGSDHKFNTIYAILEKLAKVAKRTVLV